MSKKIIILIVATVILVALWGVRVINQKRYANELKFIETHYIFDRNFSPAKPRSISGNPYYHQGRVTSETLNLFASLQESFPLTSPDKTDHHLQEVRRQLFLRFPSNEAQPLFDIYAMYLNCETEVAQNARFRAGSADPRQMLVLMNRIQKYRRDRLGREAADILFGPDIKEREFIARKALIITDNTLYGQEKENRLRKLKADMWGDKDSTIGEDGKPYNRYSLKLMLYAKDFSQLSETDRKRRDDEFKKEFFTDRQIRKMEQAEKAMDTEKENLERYRVAEKNLLNTAGMTTEEKEKKIRALQEKFFGQEADAFRRSEDMRKALVK